MNNLPGEQKKLVEVAKAAFQKDGYLSIFEPCNCGSNIRHNNGGNYHDEIHLAHDGDKYFRKDDNTCEMTESEGWEECTFEQVQSTIEENADWL